MKKIKFWIWKCFHMKQLKCKGFCGNCEFYEYCKVEKKEK